MKKANASGPRYGEVAVEMGYIRRTHIKKALQVQAWRRSKGQPVPLLGEVMRELEFLTEEQVLEVFQALCDKSRQAEKGKPSFWARITGRAG